MILITANLCPEQVIIVVIVVLMVIVISVAFDDHNGVETDDPSHLLL